MTRREAGTKRQGTDEQIAYRVDTTTWGGYDADASVKLTDSTGDVSETHLSGDPSVNGNVITTPLVIGLGADIKYTLHIQWKFDGNTFDAYCYIIGEK